ncbi:MAG: ferritin-like domain-containing protein [Gammaproteobacteria bacterium]
MTRHWTLNDIPWDQIDRSAVDPELLETVKAAALVEANSQDYVTYLHNVFNGDEDFSRAATHWGVEERQHGDALGKWAEIIDPEFSFEESLKCFQAGYSLPLNAAESVRGSRSGELVARCVVESGTCSFYSAIRDRTSEPVLRKICAYIAQDEALHYRLFHTHLKRYLDNRRLGFWQKFKIAAGRVFEIGDDELAYAYYSANLQKTGADYDRKTCADAYSRRATQLYDFKHIQTAVRMILLATDVNAYGRFSTWATKAAWWSVQRRNRRLAAV